MGILQSVQQRRVFLPGAHATIGRAASCDLVLQPDYVSSTHAILRWNGTGWEIRDLHSRNGTFLNGRRLVPGERALVPSGARLSFGSSASTWSLTADDPPRARAVAPGGEVVSAAGGLIALPADEAPEVQVFEAGDGRWRAESAESDYPVADGDVVVAGGLPWRLRLPGVLPHTVDPNSLRDNPDQHRLTVFVSTEEDYVELQLEHPDGRVDRLEHRAHHPLILLLARARIADADSSPREQGWIYVEVAEQELGVDAARLSLHIFRARQALAGVGLPNAAGLIERRRGSGQIRLGLGRVLVVRL